MPSSAEILAFTGYLCFNEWLTQLLYYNPLENLWFTWGCSSWTWTGIWDDVRNPLSDVISNSVLGRSNSVFPRYNFLKVFYLGKTEFDLPKTEFEMTSLRGFLTSSQIPVHVQLLHPQVDHRFSKGLYQEIYNYLVPSKNWNRACRYFRVSPCPRIPITGSD